MQSNIKVTIIELQEGVASVIAILKKTRPRFDKVKKFWIGADYSANKWKWTVSRQIFNGRFQNIAFS